MQYTRLILSDKQLTRDHFLNQPRKLFILPDNLPDFRLPRNKLYDSQNRAGLAECMRPNFIGGTLLHPIYDVNIVGIPTISFDTKEGLSIKHIAEGFSNIYRLINSGEYDEIVVPYKDGKPAFGGGVAGELPALIKNSIEEEFIRLEKFLANKVVTNDFPEEYRKAYVEGPLPIKATLRERFKTYLNDRFPRMALAIQSALVLGATWGIYSALAATFSAIPLGLSVITAAALAVGLYQITTLLLFGNEKVDFKMSKKGDVHASSKSWSGSVLRYLGLGAPYKPTLTQVEGELKTTLGTYFKQMDGQTETAYKDEMNAYVKFYAHHIILSNADTAFYETDIKRVKSKDYDVDAQVAEYRRKRNG